MRCERSDSVGPFSVHVEEPVESLDMTLQVAQREFQFSGFWASHEQPRSIHSSENTQPEGQIPNSQPDPQSAIPCMTCTDSPELAVFDARLYIRVRRLDQSA